jgi:hypothetical protein
MCRLKRLSYVHSHEAENNRKKDPWHDVVWPLHRERHHRTSSIAISGAVDADT